MRALVQERILPTMHLVHIAALRGTEACVRVIRHGDDPLHRDAVRKDGVQAVQEAVVERLVRRPIEVQEKTGGVDARVRAAATDNDHLVLVQDQLQGALHFRLHARRVRLYLPAAEGRAVEGDLQEVAGKDLHDADQMIRRSEDQVTTGGARK